MRVQYYIIVVVHAKIVFNLRREFASAPPNVIVRARARFASIFHTPIMVKNIQLSIKTDKIL